MTFAIYGYTLVLTSWADVNIFLTYFQNYDQKFIYTLYILVIFDAYADAQPFWSTARKP